ncbi:MAG: AraC family transcriptional regulator [Pseudomonadales bacterium]|nr:AraC family transcriptional regulator [Pseudomonadales bacterium]
MSGRTIPIRLVLLLLEGAKRGGVPAEELLERVGVPVEVLHQEDARIDKHLFIRLMLEVMRRTQDEFMGFGEGRVSKPGTFSMMAHAVINCATLEKAILRGSKFYELFNFSIFSRLRVEDEEEAIIRYFVRDEIEFQSDILEATVFLTLRFLSWLIGQQIVPKKICFDFPCIDDGEYASQFSCPVFYNQSHTQIVFDQRYLNMPLVQNALSLSKFLKASLKELMEGDIESASLNARIRSIISKEFGNNFPDFSVICEKLNMTPQTLRRRLKDENTSYQEIKDSIRKDASVFYLSKHELTIDEIAMLMGFSEASSFHRAFKKWTGKTPSVYRQELLDQAGQG